MNFKMKIILTEQSTLASNGNSLNNNLSKKFHFFKITKEQKEFSDCSLLIKHGTVNNYQWDNNKNYWYIETGGSKSDMIPKDKNTAGSISWNTFVENVENFLTHIRSKTEIKKEDIEVLYAIDPKLEELLTPFASTSPYETANKQGNILKDAKAVLQTYVGEYLKKQRKP